MEKELSNRAIQRLTLYDCILSDYLREGKTTISSSQVASLLGIDGSQVRKDIAACRISGRNKVGYQVAELKSAIERLLGFKENKPAFVIGAGNIGSALAKYDDFKDFGLFIKALFDTDEGKIGSRINGKPVLALSELSNAAAREQVEIAILTVPREAAQNSAGILAKAGIKYIWNFTHTVLSVPKDIKVYNENIIANFLQFTRPLLK